MFYRTNFYRPVYFFHFFAVFIVFYVSRKRDFSGFYLALKEKYFFCSSFFYYFCFVFFFFCEIFEFFFSFRNQKRFLLIDPKSSRRPIKIRPRRTREIFLVINSGKPEAGLNCPALIVLGLTFFHLRPLRSYTSTKYA